MRRLSSPHSDKPSLHDVRKPVTDRRWRWHGLNIFYGRKIGCDRSGGHTMNQVTGEPCTSARSASPREDGQMDNPFGDTTHEVNGEPCTSARSASPREDGQIG